MFIKGNIYQMRQVILVIGILTALVIMLIAANVFS